MRIVTRQHALVYMLLCLFIAAAVRFSDLPTVPPGVHYDEAANGVLAADIGLRGETPVFIAGYTGKEPLFFYLAGGLMRLLGVSTFALRLTATYVGILTVAVTYWLGREMRLDRRICLIAATLLAVSFWHLVFSHLGFRAITQPLLQGLTLAALFRGLRHENWRWVVIAGVFLGLTAYTYLAARVFPILLLLTLLPFLLHPQTRHRRWRQLTLFGLVALGVLLPLLLYFWANPEAFWVRISQVSPESEGALSIWESLLRSLEMLFLVGDPYIRFNLPGRPLFNWFWGGLLLVGWLVSVSYMRRFGPDWQRAVTWLLVFTPLIMLLPTALAIGEIVPSNLRAIGLIPMIFYLPGLGLLMLLQSVEQWLRSRLVTFAMLSIGLVVLLLGGILTDRLYYETWAGEPDLFYETDGDMTAVARYLNERNWEDETIYVASLHYQHPTVAFLSETYDRVKWLPEGRALPLPREGKAVYIYPAKSPPPPWAEEILGATSMIGDTAVPNAFIVYQTDNRPTINIPNPINANFNNLVTLLGYEMQPAPAGETLPLRLYWRVENNPPADLTPFVHLEDAWRHRWSQAETFAYPAAQWTPGDVVVQQVDVSLPPGAPPDAYALRVGFFNPGTGEQLPLLDENGRFAGSAYTIQNALVTAGGIPDPLPRPPFSIYKQAAPGLRLLGYERGSFAAETGETIHVGLWWQATRPLPPLTTRLELLPPNNMGRILTNVQPVHNTYPFAEWEIPQFLIDRQAVRLPENLAAGNYRLHLRLLDENEDTILTADLGSLAVAKTERLYRAPTPQFPLSATFGEEIALRGYDVAAGADNREFDLRLIWEALREPTEDYTVFVHVLRADGTCCIWQQDVMPQQNQYPTSRWLPGEVVLDEYPIVLPPETPPGAYLMEVGLYIAETGKRLRVTLPPLPEDDMAPLRPLLVQEE